MPDRKKEQPSSALRYAGLGMELVGAVAGFAFLGFWIDRHYETSPWGVLISTVLGLIGGLYNLIRQSLAAFSRSQPRQGQQGKSTDFARKRFPEEDDPDR